MEGILRRDKKSLRVGKMCAKMSDSIVIHKLAADLRLRPSHDPVQAILRHCNRKITKILTDYGGCSTVAELLDLLANKLGTWIVEIKTDPDLHNLQARYVNRGELAFATVGPELSGPDDFGITFRLLNPQAWEQPYVSVIDCRGPKRLRRYHTKWHEIGHLLILTDQTRLAFRRSHSHEIRKSAEESLVDTIAGELSFYPSLVSSHLSGTISFRRIEELRDLLCPDASTYSAVLNLSRMWPTACIWLEAKLAARKRDEAELQGAFAFKDPPQKTLRAIHTQANGPARGMGLAIIPRFRVPQASIISRIFQSGLSVAEADEDLGWWESSSGTRLRPCKVRVHAKRIGDSIHALLVPA
jgi:hypothetical protein